MPDFTYTMASTREELSPKVRYVLKTGIDAFDDLVGGFPFGHICEVFGLETSGKTNLVIRSCIRAQVGHIYEVTGRNGHEVMTRKLGPDEYDVSVVYIDNEQSITEDKVFCDTEDSGELTRMDANVGDCDTVDMVFKIIDISITTCEGIESETGRKQFVVFVLDTVAATSSRDELAQEWGKVDYPRHAVEWRKGFRQLTRRIKRGNVCAIFTNQVSDNFKEQAKKGRPQSNTPQAADYSTFGGKALKYYSHFRVFMFNTGARYRLNKDTQFPDGFQIGFVSVKNRVKKPLREGRMALLFARNPEQTDGGLHNRFSTLETLLHLKHAEFDDATKEIKFKFDLHGVPMTTFGDTGVSLDEADTGSVKRGARAKRNPKIAARGEWLNYYAQHKADFDALYASAIRSAFNTDAPTTEIVDVEGDLPGANEEE